jgi:hypothetical protein
MELNMDRFRVWRAIGEKDLKFVANTSPLQVLFFSDANLLFERVSDEVELLLDRPQLEVEIER